MPRAARKCLMFDMFSKIFYLNLMILGSENSAFPKKHASLIYEFLYPTAPARVQICTRDLAGRPVWVRIRTKNTAAAGFPPLQITTNRFEYHKIFRLRRAFPLARAP